MKELQPGYIGNFSHCDRITDKTLPIILFPVENVRSEAALLCGIRVRPIYIDLHDGKRTLFRKDVPLQCHHP